MAIAVAEAFPQFYYCFTTALLLLHRHSRLALAVAEAFAQKDVLYTNMRMCVCVSVCLSAY